MSDRKTHMETRRHGNGWGAFLEHAGFSVACIVGLVSLQCFLWVGHLHGAGWVRAYAGALVVGLVAIAFLFYAKWPSYRRGRFLSVGPRELSPGRRRLYWVGVILSCVDIAFLGGLLFAHP